MKHNRSILIPLLLSQLNIAPLVAMTPATTLEPAEQAVSAQPAPSAVELDGQNLSLLEVPANAQVTMGNNYSLVDQASIGCDDRTGPKTAPRRVYDFSKDSTNAPLGAKQTRTAVILNQVYNTIEPQAVWTASTAASKDGDAAFTISNPGKYILTGDLQINAQVNGSAGVGSGVIGIAITTSNVTLDLNGYTISQSSSSLSAGYTGVVGIYVKNSSTSLYNITIQNGQISSIGVNDTSGTRKGSAMIVGEGTKNHYGVTIDNIRITKCSDLGLKLNKINDAAVTNVSATDFINNLTGSALTTYGLQLESCNNVTVRDASFSGLATTADTTLATTYGIYINRGTNISLLNCATNNNTAALSGGSATVYGTYIYNDSGSTSNQNITLTNCSASYNQTTSSASGGDVVGFKAATSSSTYPTYTLIFNNCTANNNIGSAAAGFNTLYANSVQFQRCQASYNNSNGNSSVYGFYFNAANYGLIKDCLALGQSTYPSTASVVNAVGISLSDSCSYFVIDSCTCAEQIANGSNSSAYGISFGVSTGPTNCIVKNCQLYNNKGSGKTFGFKDFATASKGSSTILLSNIAYGQGKISPSTGNLSSSLSNANYQIQYGAANGTHNAQDIFKEANATAIGAITTTGLGMDYVNISLIS